MAEMLIVGCQACGETKVLAGAPDRDGVARMNWCCPRCGAGQVLQLEVAPGGAPDLHSVLGGMGLGGALTDGHLDALGRRRGDFS